MQGVVDFGEAEEEGRERVGKIPLLRKQKRIALEK